MPPNLSITSHEIRFKNVNCRYSKRKGKTYQYTLILLKNSWLRKDKQSGFPFPYTAYETLPFISASLIELEVVKHIQLLQAVFRNFELSLNTISFVLSGCVCWLLHLYQTAFCETTICRSGFKNLFLLTMGLPVSFESNKVQNYYVSRRTCR